MRTLFILIFLFVCQGLVDLFGQAPQAFSYQAVARNQAGEAITYQNVNLKISILSGSVDGAPVYIETHSTQTNQFGLINLQIGNGTKISGDFTIIDWGHYAYFLKVEIDETGGTDYKHMGTTQLLAVPYALYAEKAGNVDDADADPQNELITDVRLNGTTLTIVESDEKTVDLSSLKDGTGTDDQNLIFTTDVLSIENGTGSVDLSQYIENEDTTNEIQDLQLDGNILTITLKGTPTQIDLDPYLDNTDTQDLSLTDNTLSLTGDASNVDLTKYMDNTDDQDLILTGDVLSIENGAGSVDLSQYIENEDTTNEIQDLQLDGNILLITLKGTPTQIDLSPYFDNTDEQDLSLTDNTLSLTGDASNVDLAKYIDNTDDQNLILTGDVLSIENGAGSVDLSHYNDEDADTTNELQDLALNGNELSITKGNSVVLSGVVDLDADPTNEIQDLQLDGNILTITLNGTPTQINLSTYLDNTDNQLLSISNDTIYLSDGGSVKLPEDQVIDNDNDPTNEFQAISISNDTIYLSNGGFVKLPPDQDNDWLTSGNNIYRNTGNVGIGLSNPSEKLEINGTLKADSLKGDGSNITGITTTNFWSDAGNHIYANNATGSFNVVVTDDAFLGIGTNNPQGELHVSNPSEFGGITFNGTGINDLSVEHSYYNGTGDTYYKVVVTNPGPTPNIIKCSNDNGSTWTENVNMASSGIDIGNGVTIGFTSLSGHTYNDEWNFTVGESFMNGLVVKEGKVGIGTIIPVEKLDVNGNIRATRYYGDGSTLTGIGSGTGGIINTGSTTIGADSDDDGSGEIVLQTGGTTKLSITNNGNVGIGTINPSSSLEVKGSIVASSIDDDNDAYISLKGKYSGISGFTYQDDDTTGLWLKLHRSRGTINTPLIVSDNDFLAGIEAFGYDGGDFNKAAGIYFQVNGSPQSKSIPGNILFMTRKEGTSSEPSEKLRITNDGKLGLGVSNPSEKLEVIGNIKANNYIGDGSALTGIGAGTGGVINSGSTTIGADSDLDGLGEIAFQTKDITRLVITNDGNIGIGTQFPQSILHISFDLDANSDSSILVTKKNIGIGTDTPQNKIDIKGNSAIGDSYAGNFQAPENGLIIEGKVGIGTNNPSEMLEVIGAIKGYGIVPIGSVQAWLKSYLNTPPLPNGWVECDGQTLDDPDSPFNGQIIPNLNSDNAILIGNTISSSVPNPEIASASTGTDITGGHDRHADGPNSGEGHHLILGDHSHTLTGSMINTYNIVWIMRVK